MNEKIKGYTNIGVDEEGHIIGNCQKCGLHGVLINDHKCKNHEQKD